MGSWKMARAKGNLSLPPPLSLSSTSLRLSRKKNENKCPFEAVELFLCKMQVIHICLLSELRCISIYWEFSIQNMFKCILSGKLYFAKGRNRNSNRKALNFFRRGQQKQDNPERKRKKPSNVRDFAKDLSKAYPKEERRELEMKD